MTVIDRVSRQSLGNIAFIPTIKDGLIGLYQPRKNAQEAVINRAPTGGVATLVGSPTFGDFGALLGPTAYLETVHPETTEFTLISVANKNPAGGVALVSTLAGSASTTPNAALNFRLSPTPVRMGADVKTSPDSAAESFGFDFPPADISPDFFAVACSTTTLTMMMPRNPAQDPDGIRSVALSGSRDDNTAAWRIGAARVTTALFPNSTVMYLAMIFNRALTELEIRAVYAEARAYFAPRGIAI